MHGHDGFEGEGRRRIAEWPREAPGHRIGEGFGLGEPWANHPGIRGWHDAGPVGPMFPRSSGEPNLAWRLVRYIGARANIVPVIAMMAGLAMPALSEAVHPFAILLLAATVFAGFMSADRAAVGGADARRALAALPVATLGSAAACWAIGLAMTGDAELASWMALLAAAPVASITVVHAGSLGLPNRAVANLAFSSTLAAPLILPAVAWAFVADGSIAPAEVAMRVLPAVLAPAGLALVLGRVPALTDGRVMARADWRGVSASALAGLGLARVHGLLPLVEAAPATAAGFVALGLLVSVVGGLLVALCRWPGGLRAALLTGGCRNAALVWAVTLPLLPPAGQMFMVLSLVPAYLIPLIVRWMPSRLTRTVEAGN